MRSWTFAAILGACLLTGCRAFELEPQETRTAHFFWLTMPERVINGRVFRIDTYLWSLGCNAKGDFVLNHQEADDAIELTAQWINFDPRAYGGYCVLGSIPFPKQLFVQSPTVDAPVRMPLRINGKTFGWLTVGDSAEYGTVASGTAAFYVDSLGCDRVRPGFISGTGGYILGDPQPERPQPFTRLFVIGYLEPVSPQRCGADAVYRIVLAAPL